MPRKSARKNPSPESDPLTRRERQIMDLVFAAGSITARGIWGKMEDPPTYSTVRTLLGVLERKGQLAHRREGKAYVYFPRQKRQTVAASALRRLVSTFFEGSVEQAVSGLLDLNEADLSEEEIDRVSQIIEKAKARKQQP